MSVAVLERSPAAVGPWPGPGGPGPGRTGPGPRDRFAAALSGARATAGLTQEELADRSGMSVRAIRNLETGRTGRPRRQSVRLLADALGVPPGHLVSPARPGSPAVFAADAAAAGSAVSELPVGCADPVGRAALYADLCGRLTQADGFRRLAVVTGPPGSGKTTFVTHVAHLLSREFPDRQVYVDLDGHPEHPGEPMSATAVAARLLRSFGFERLPSGPEELLARARAALAAHRAVVVLDNVVSEAQVRPLICASARAVILVAARRALAALPGAQSLRLGGLDEEAAITMLARLAGPQRVAGDPAAAAGIARSCDYLPLALHIAGLQLAARPHLPLRDLAERLTRDHARLDLLRVGDLSLHASVAAAVGRLTEPQRAALRRMRALPGWFGVGDAARLLALPESAAADLIDDLVQSQVIRDSADPSAGTPAGLSPGACEVRYRLHESFRLYAARCSTAPGR